jgi:hypothetical protein
LNVVVVLIGGHFNKAALLADVLSDFSAFTRPICLKSR